MVQRANRIATKSGKPSDAKRYREISNKVRQMTRDDHKQYLEQITASLYANSRDFLEVS